MKKSSSAADCGNGSKVEASIVRLAGGVENLHCAEMPGGRGVIEQDQITNLGVALLSSGDSTLLVTARNDRSSTSKLRAISASIVAARFSTSVAPDLLHHAACRASTLAQTVEKPITVASDEAISNFADSRHGFAFWRFPSRIVHSAIFYGCAINIAGALNTDNDALIG